VRCVVWDLEIGMNEWMMQQSDERVVNGMQWCNKNICNEVFNLVLKL
jgi:hypothetical protein